MVAGDDIGDCRAVQTRGQVRDFRRHERAGGPAAELQQRRGARHREGVPARHPGPPGRAPAGLRAAQGAAVYPRQRGRRGDGVRGLGAPPPADDASAAPVRHGLQVVLLPGFRRARGEEAEDRDAHGGRGRRQHVRHRVRTLRIRHRRRRGHREGGRESRWADRVGRRSERRGYRGSAPAIHRVQPGAHHRRDLGPSEGSRPEASQVDRPVRGCGEWDRA